MVFCKKDRLHLISLLCPISFPTKYAILSSLELPVKKIKKEKKKKEKGEGDGANDISQVESTEVNSFSLFTHSNLCD